MPELTEALRARLSQRACREGEGMRPHPARLFLSLWFGMALLLGFSTAALPGVIWSFETVVTVVVLAIIGSAMFWLILAGLAGLAAVWWDWVTKP
jgi:hypothetical protein